MMRLIDQPTGIGELYEDGRRLGTVHYNLNVYQQYDEGADRAVAGVQHIEGRVTAADKVDLLELSGRSAQLLLKLSDGRTVNFQIRDDLGNIVANESMTTP